MDRRNISRALFAAAGSALLVGARAEAQTCSLPCYPRTPAEVSAGVTPVSYHYLPGNVLRYGTNTSPGTTDMTSAMNMALLVGDDVFIPAGTYLITDSLVYRNNANIEGAGYLNTVIKGDLGGKSFFRSAFGELPSSAQRSTGIRIAKLAIFPNTAATILPGSIGINLRNAQYCTVENVLMQYVDIGVATNQIAQYNVYDRLIVQVANTGVYLESVGGGNRLMACDIGGNVVCIDLHSGAYEVLGTTAEATSSGASYIVRAGRPGGANCTVHASCLYTEGTSTGTATLQIESSVTRSHFSLHRHSTLGPIVNNAGESCMIEVAGQGYFNPLYRTQRIEFCNSIDGVPQSSLRSNGGNTLELRNSANTGYGDFYARSMLMMGPATPAAGTVSLGNSIQTSVGGAGGAAALPATPAGYLRFYVGNTEFVIPYYPRS